MTRSSPNSVVCDNSAHRGLRGVAVVEFEQASEPRTARDRACADRCCLGRDELVAQTLVRPLLMIMLDKRSYGSPEVLFAEWHDPLQALGLGRPNKPLGKRVQIWTTGRQDQWLHATPPQQAPKGGGVERVSVQDEVLNAAQETVASVGQVPCDLRHPGLVRLTRDSGDLDRAGLEFHDEEDDVADQSPMVSTAEFS